MKIRFKETLDLMIEAVYLLIVFLIPLTFSIWFTTYNVFELNKIVVFKILFFVLLFLTLTKILFFNFKAHRDKMRVLSKYWIAPLVFVVGIAVTLLFSIDIDKSWQGSYIRQAGFINYIFYFLWFVLLSFNLMSINNGSSLRMRVERIINVAVWSGLLVAIYGVLQIFNIDFIAWAEAPYITQRAMSSLGQPNFLASFLLLIIPLGVYLVYKNSSSLGRVFYTVTVLIQVVCLFFTSSRGAFLSLIAMVLIFTLYLLLRSSLSTRKKILSVLVLFVMMIGGVIGMEKALPGRFSSLIDYEGGSVAARVNFYQAAADAISKKPVFGYGLESGESIFIKYYQADWAINGDVNSTADRAHNIVLDILLTTGFWGLIFFIVLYYSFFVVMRSNVREGSNRALSLALGLGAGAYLFSLLFSFSIVVGEIYFWLFFAMLIVLGREEMFGLRVRRETMPRILVFIVILTISLIFIGRQFSVLKADHYFNKLYYDLADKNYATAFVLYDYIQHEKISNSQQRYYDYFLGDKLSDFYLDIDELVIKEQVKRRLMSILEHHPEKSYKDFLVKARINSVLENYTLSEDYFAQVNAYTINWPRGYFELARMLSARGDLVPAIASYHLAEINLPSLENEYLEGRHRDVVLYYRYVIYKDLAELYEGDEDYVNAGRYYQKAYQSYPHDFVLLKKIADSYYFQGDIAKAIEYNQHGFVRSPQDYNWPLALAILYKDNGNSERAVLFLDKAIELAPEEKWLEELKQGYE